MLAEQLDSMNRDDLLVLDRGYPAYCLFALFNQRDRAFCMRLATSFSPQVRAFVASGHASAIVTVEPGKEPFPAFKKHDLPIKSFQLRLVRVRRPSGLIEVLATNRLDETRNPAVDFAELSHRRWRIEEAFRHIKCRLLLEQFGGETPLVIRQEFHATILLHNLATLAGMDALAQLEDAEA